MLFQHDRVSGKHHAGEIVYGFFRRHFGVKWLICKKAPTQIADFLLWHSDCRRGDLLMVPTTRSFLPLKRTGRAEISDCDASSMMTRSKSPISDGIVSHTRHSGKTQHGTAR